MKPEEPARRRRAICGLPFEFRLANWNRVSSRLSDMQAMAPLARTAAATTEELSEYDEGR